MAHLLTHNDSPSSKGPNSPTMDGIFAYQNGSAAGATQMLDIHSSLPELKNDTRDIAQTIEQALPSIQQICKSWDGHFSKGKPWLRRAVVEMRQCFL